jgi:nitrite reductase/ring-hydroxylating ferredoxin subunit
MRLILYAKRAQRRPRPVAAKMREINLEGASPMSQLVRICSQAELPAAGEVGEFTVDGRTLCVANLNGTISVLDGVCPHEEGPLGEGVIEDGRVVCPWHGYAFDVRTGVSEQDPDLKAQVFESAVEDGELRAKV